MMTLDLVDVFGSGALRGNPLAVVHGAEDLTADQMLALTQWLGFSETTFLLPPTDPKADYRVRIFYPAGELPFAGHPTLGSCFAWLAAGGVAANEGSIIQECGAGLIEVQQQGDQYAFAAPPMIKEGPLSDDERRYTASIAGVPEGSIAAAVHVQNGPQWQLLQLASAKDVLACEPAAKAPPGTDIGVAGPCGSDDPADWELRAFFANQHGQIIEDPVTGSFNAGVADYLFKSGQAKGAFVAAQGRKTGADGRVHCRKDDDGSVWIGGRCDMIARGGALAAPD